jgi:hypothetical protein
MAEALHSRHMHKIFLTFIALATSLSAVPT